MNCIICTPANSFHRYFLTAYKTQTVTFFTVNVLLKGQRFTNGTETYQFPSTDKENDIKKRFLSLHCDTVNFPISAQDCLEQLPRDDMVLSHPKSWLVIVH